jgi:predicted NBD/HSP70 family sugar kinase
MSNPISKAERETRFQAYALLSRFRQLSRSDVAKELGINVLSVKRTMQYFIDRGMAKDLGGSAAKRYVFVPEAAHAIAAIYEGSVLSVGMVNIGGELVIDETLEVTGEISELLVTKPSELARRLIRKLPAQGIKVERLLGFGICLPGVVNHEAREISLAPSLGIEKPYSLGPLMDELSASLNLPVYMENDVNAAVYGEARFRNSKDLAFIALGSGVGMGLVLDGKLRCGPTYSAGEAGLLPYQNLETTDKQTKILSIEQIIGLEALKERYGFNHWYELSDLSDRHKAEMLDLIAKATAHIIISCAAILDIKDFALGGILVDLLGDRLLERTRERAELLSPFQLDIQTNKCVNPAISGIARVVIDNEITHMPVQAVLPQA